MLDLIMICLAFTLGIFLGSSLQDPIKVPDVQLIEAKSFCSTNQDVDYLEVGRHITTVCTNGARFQLKEAV